MDKIGESLGKKFLYMVGVNREGDEWTDSRGIRGRINGI